MMPWGAFHTRFRASFAKLVLCPGGLAQAANLQTIVRWLDKEADQAYLDSRPTAAAGQGDRDR